MTVKELIQRLADGSVLVIDVRLAKDGIIPGAVHIPVTDLEDQTLDWAPETAIVVFCQHGGGGSDYAAEVLKEKGYRQVYKLVGGMDDWNRQSNHV
ncbi:rhodanese-like domain-containing protein [Alicyclobacillus sp. ALC3]|uniref:rhodanese-like domain-containing protein n=1 Tax=Alicyclobacillus sp. ALC3 TaxID=2796143 RepID=UPI003FCD0036